MKFLTVPLGKNHKKRDFNCGQPSLDRYLHEQAGQDMRRKLSLCFVLSDEDERIVGYYTLANASIPKNQVPESIQKKLGYENLPVTLLGRLAVDQKYHGKGIGKLLLMDALHRSVEVSINQVASFAVVTDPIDEDAARFYVYFGFIRLVGSQRLFIPMKTIESLFF